eukprot:m.761933 g.761933  ORF g.761933 m.761933 type:complete len:672 (+) comp23206_c0_seq1:389-2404(+)
MQTPTQSKQACRAWLTPIEGSSDVKLKMRMEGKTYVGRGRTCDIVIQSAGMMVSRRHIVIVHTKVRQPNSTGEGRTSFKDTFTLIENCAVNGTMINNTRLQDGSRHVLSDGDIIGLGCKDRNMEPGAAVAMDKRLVFLFKIDTSSIDPETNTTTGMPTCHSESDADTEPISHVGLTAVSTSSTACSAIESNEASSPPHRTSTSIVAGARQSVSNTANSFGEPSPATVSSMPSSKIILPSVASGVPTLPCSQTQPATATAAQSPMEVTVIDDEDDSDDALVVTAHHASKRRRVDASTKTQTPSKAAIEAGGTDTARATCESATPAEGTVPAKPAAAPAAAAATPFAEEDYSDLRCVVCFELFIKARTLPCSHSFCELCILKAVQRRRQCPTCNHKLPRSAQDGVPTRVLDHLVDGVVSKMSAEDRSERAVVVKERAEETTAFQSKHTSRGTLSKAEQQERVMTLLQQRAVMREESAARHRRQRRPSVQRSRIPSLESDSADVDTAMSRRLALFHERQQQRMSRYTSGSSIRHPRNEPMSSSPHDCPPWRQSTVARKSLPQTNPRMSLFAPAAASPPDLAAYCDPMPDLLAPWHAPPDTDDTFTGITATIACPNAPMPALMPSGQTLSRWLASTSVSTSAVPSDPTPASYAPASSYTHTASSSTVLPAMFRDL